MTDHPDIIRPSDWLKTSCPWPLSNQAESQALGREQFPSKDKRYTLLLHTLRTNNPQEREFHNKFVVFAFRTIYNTYDMILKNEKIEYKFCKYRHLH